MQRKIVIVVASLIYLFFVSNSYGSEFNNRFSDILFSEAGAGQILFREEEKLHAVNYRFYSQNNQYNEQAIRQAVEMSSGLLMEYILEFGYLHTDCRSSDTLDIYEISIADLNEPGRVSPATIERGRTILGYFDTLPDDSSRVIMMITYNRNSHLIAHEMAHYMFDRFCIWRFSDIDSELFAIGFEHYFRRKASR